MNHLANVHVGEGRLEETRILRTDITFLSSSLSLESETSKIEFFFFLAKCSGQAVPNGAK